MDDLRHQLAKARFELEERTQRTYTRCLIGLAISFSLYAIASIIEVFAWLP